METDEKPDFILAVECNDLILNIRINDIIVFKNVGERRAFTLRINDFVVDGTNMVSVEAKLPANLENAEVEASSNSYARVIVQKNDQQVYAFLFPQNPPIKLPITDIGELISATQHGLWCWQTIEKIKLDNESAKAATDHIRTMINACEAKDIEQLMNIFQVKNKEHATAFYQKREYYLQEQNTFFEERLNSPVWELEQVNYERINYELCGDGRMVLAQAPYNESILKWIDYKGMNTVIPLYLSLINGEWVIVR